MRKLTTEEFIAKSRLVHGNTYDYSKVVYINNSTKVQIICPMHGEFEQTPGNHLQGQGCPQCAGNTPSTTKKFIEKALLVHKGKYTYDKVRYTGNRASVLITCQIHGDFSQAPHDHLKGSGCVFCGINDRTDLKRSSAVKFINKALLMHGDKYDYSKVVYVGNKTKVTIVCPIHGEFEQKPANHLSGRGCPSCAKYGFDSTKAAYLYYLKVTTEDGKILYKIGITNRTVDERFNLTDLSKIEIVKQKLYENGKDALEWETKFKRQFKEHQYVGPNILESGNTELFTIDIMRLWAESS